MAILVLIHEGVMLKKIIIDKPEIRIGRRVNSDIYIDDRFTSQNHARIVIGKHTFKFVEERAALGEQTAKLHRSWIPGVYYTRE